MEKRPGNAVKPLPACADASFALHLATNAILTPRDLVKVPPSINIVGFSYSGLKSLPEVGVMSCIPCPFKREKILKTVRNTGFFQSRSLLFSIQLIVTETGYHRI